MRHDPPNQHKQRTFDRSVALPPQSFLAVKRPSCGRYMAPVLIILLLFGQVAVAVTCIDYVPPNGEEISVEIDEDFFNISLPSQLDGEVLGLLGLYIYQKLDGEEQEIFVPLAIEYSGVFAKSKFHISKIKGEIEIVASYGDSICGPELRFEYAI